MKYIQVIIFILISQTAGIIGSIFTSSSIADWYVNVNKPSFNPPNWIFGPVWITLYTLMGIASYLIWKARKKNLQTKTALIIYAVHLVLNVLWSIIFFGLRNPGMAFVEIIILLIMILATMYWFFKINKTAFYLFVPYLLWVSFASVLNFYIWKLN